MNAIDLKHAFRTPDLVFGHPQRVVAATALSHDDKIFVLRRWKQSLERLWGADDAGAGRGPSAPEVSATLAAISRALNELCRQ